MSPGAVRAARARRAEPDADRRLRAHPVRHGARRCCDRPMTGDVARTVEAVWRLESARVVGGRSVPTEHERPSIPGITLCGTFDDLLDEMEELQAAATG